MLLAVLHTELVVLLVFISARLDILLVILSNRLYVLPVVLPTGLALLLTVLSWLLVHLVGSVLAEPSLVAKDMLGKLLLSLVEDVLGKVTLSREVFMLAEFHLNNIPLPMAPLDTDPL